MNIKVGFGYDVHQLETGRKLILGGVEIPSEKGPVAHSDGDVLIHAICDALLGAVGLRDIGFHFPDSNDEYKGISSMIILHKTLSLLKKHHYKVGNVDATICLQQPKIKDYIEPIKEKLADVIKTGTKNISIKATTTEHLGFVGEGKGIATYAIVLISKNHMQ